MGRLMVSVFAKDPMLFKKIGWLTEMQADPRYILFMVISSQIIAKLRLEIQKNIVYNEERSNYTECQLKAAVKGAQMLL